VSHQAHATAVVDEGATIGDGTRIWHFSHVMSGARVGARCVLGQNVYVGGGAVIGAGCHLQNNVSVYDGVVLEDDVFVGPSAVFTNVRGPRAFVSRKHAFVTTRVGRGATIGANATIVCGVAIGAYAFVGAGAVVTRDVPSYALVTGVPARRAGWACRCGEMLPRRRAKLGACGACGARYEHLGRGAAAVLRERAANGPRPARGGRGRAAD